MLPPGLPPHHPTSNLTRCDLILRGGTLFDGTGAPGIRADIGLVGDRIAVIGDLSRTIAGRVIEIYGLFVCPGFIDIHTHSDLSVLYTPGMDSSLSQGVTTEVVGNCGLSLGLARDDAIFLNERRNLERNGITLDWSDLAGFLKRVGDSGIAINLATLAGHGTLRKRVMGLSDQRPSAEEMAAMQREFANALEAGAVGLSSGLEYVPGMYADVAEMATLARMAAESGGFYATHLRDEGDGLIEAVEEAIRVARSASVPLQLSHHKAEKPSNWGKVVQTLALVDAAQVEGLDVLLDQYPYTAYQTSLSTIALPAWAVAGTPLAIARRLRDPDIRSAVRAEMSGLDWKQVVIASCPSHREYQGQSIAQLAEQAHQDSRDWLLALFDEAEGVISAAHFALSEADVERVLSDNRVMVGSDAVAIAPVGVPALDRPHPRSYGTFARVFARYVREKNLLTWEEAIRRMTTLPASRLRLKDRGEIAPGYFADIVVFDPKTIADTATFALPHSFAIGVEYVFVGGTLAFEQGKPTGTRSGSVLRRKG